MQPHILHECLGLHYDQFTHPHHVDIVPVQSDVMAAAQKHFHIRTTLPFPDLLRL